MYTTKSTHIGDITAISQIKSMYTTKSTHIGDSTATAKSRTRTALHESIEWSQRTEYPKESALGDAVDTVMKRSQSDAIISYPPTMHPSGSTGALDTLTLNNLMAMASEGIAMGRQQITLDSHTYKALMNAFLQGKNSSFSPSLPSSFFFCFNHNNSTTCLR